MCGAVTSHTYTTTSDPSVIVIVNSKYYNAYESEVAGTSGVPIQGA